MYDLRFYFWCGVGLTAFLVFIVKAIYYYKIRSNGKKKGRK